MRLPQIRITVANLLFAVSIAALNCAVARRYYPALAGSRHSYLEWSDQLEVMVGLLPLLNVAIIGVSLCLAKALLSLRRHRAVKTPLAPPGFTFFSAHLVALACVICFLMPSRVQDYRAFLRPVANLAESTYSHVLSEKTTPFAWLVLESLKLAIFLSGPPVLLAWLGGKVATRGAATLSRPRFLATACLVSLGFVLTGVAVAVTPQPFREYRHPVDLDFLVVEQGTGKPIPASFIRIRSVFRSWITPASAFTDRDGRARLTPKLMTTGERSLFRTFGSFAPWGQWLEITAQGYQRRRCSLTEVLGPQRELQRRPRVYHLELARGDTLDDAFHDIAGTYDDFEIERDGRFSYNRYNGCFSTNTEEYGRIKRSGDSFILTYFSHPGMDAAFSEPATFRLIPCGERLYFCSTSNRCLHSLCRTALGLSDPRVLDIWANLRTSDKAKPLAGLPRLPLRVWLEFALGEVNLHNKEGSLRVALESLRPDPL